MSSRTPPSATRRSHNRRSLRAAIAGTDLNILQQSLNAFGAAVNPLAEIQMNEVIRQSLSGTAADELTEKSL